MSPQGPPQEPEYHWPYTPEGGFTPKQLIEIIEELRQWLRMHAPQVLERKDREGW